LRNTVCGEEVVTAFVPVEDGVPVEIGVIAEDGVPVEIGVLVEDGVPDEIGVIVEVQDTAVGTITPFALQI
jgi:hypothetical protein